MKVPVRLHFVCGYGPFSWLIARFGVQKPEFSHVDIILPDGRLLGARDDAVGGQPPGVWIRPPQYEKWLRQATVTFWVQPDAAARGLAWARGEIGCKYDEDAILGFIFGQRWHRDGAYICSVLAANYLLRCGIIEGTPQNLQGTSPNVLYADSLAVGGICSEG